MNSVVSILVFFVAINVFSAESNDLKSMTCEIAVLKVTDDNRIVDGQIYKITGEEDSINSNFFALRSDDNEIEKDYWVDILVMPSFSDSIAKTLGNSLLRLDFKLFHKDDRPAMGSSENSFYGLTPILLKDGGSELDANASYHPFDAPLLATGVIVIFPVGSVGEAIGYYDYSGLRSFTEKISELKKNGTVKVGQVVGGALKRCTVSKSEKKITKGPSSILN